MKIIYLDLETSSLDQNCDIIQIGAVAAEGDKILESFEIKIEFDHELASQDALSLNSYDYNTWAREAVKPEVAIRQFSEFLKRYADVTRISKKGSKYRVAELCGHNIIKFDYDRLSSFYKRYDEFLPADYNPIDTIQIAKFLEHLGDKRFSSHRLVDLCNDMGITYDKSVTHDALYDAKIVMRLHLMLLEAIKTRYLIF